MNIKRIIIVYLLCSYLFSNYFDSSIGKCSIVINNKNKSYLLDYQTLIQKETKKLVDTFGEVKKEPFEIIIPKTRKEFYNLAKTAPEWGIAITKSKENKIIIQPASISKISKNRFNEILIHELNHLYLHRLINNVPMPSWFVEGLAMKFSKEFSFLHKIEISKAIWKNTLIPLEGLKNFNTKNKFQIKLAYAQAAAAVNSLEYYYNKNILYEIIDLLKKENNFWESIYQLTGEDKFDFQEKYEIYITNYFLWIFLLNASNILFVLFPFILIIGYWIKRNKNITILKKWEIEEQLLETEKNDLLK